MLPAFNGMDVITFAVEIEKNGKKFYEKVSDTFEDAEIKEIFLHLAHEEENHIVIVQKCTYLHYNPLESIIISIKHCLRNTKKLLYKNNR